MKKSFLCAALLAANWCAYGADAACNFNDHVCYARKMFDKIKGDKYFPSERRTIYTGTSRKEEIEEQFSASDRNQIREGIEKTLECLENDKDNVTKDQLKLLASSWNKIFCTSRHVAILEQSGAIPMVADGILHSLQCEGVTLWRGVNIYTFLVGKLIAEVKNALTGSNYSYLPIFSSCLRSDFEAGEFENISDLMKNNRYWNHVAYDFANMNLLVNEGNSRSSMDSVSCALLGFGSSSEFPFKDFMDGLILHGAKSEEALLLAKRFESLILKYYKNRNKGALIGITIPENKVNTYAMMCCDDLEQINWPIISSDKRTPFDMSDPFNTGEVKLYKKAYLDPGIKVHTIREEPLIPDFLSEYEKIKRDAILAIGESRIDMSTPDYVRVSISRGISIKILLQILDKVDLGDENIRKAITKGIASLIINDSVSQTRKEQILNAINKKIEISTIINPDSFGKIYCFNGYMKQKIEKIPAYDNAKVCRDLISSCSGCAFLLDSLLSVIADDVSLLSNMVLIVSYSDDSFMNSDFVIDYFSDWGFSHDLCIDGLNEIKKIVEKTLRKQIELEYEITSSTHGSNALTGKGIVSFSYTDILKFAYESGMTCTNFEKMYERFNEVMDKLIEDEKKKASTAPVTLSALSETDTQQDDSAAQVPDSVPSPSM